MLPAGAFSRNCSGVTPFTRMDALFLNASSVMSRMFTSTVPVAFSLGFVVSRTLALNVYFPALRPRGSIVMIPSWGLTLKPFAFPTMEKLLSCLSQSSKSVTKTSPIVVLFRPPL